MESRCFGIICMQTNRQIHKVVRNRTQRSPLRKKGIEGEGGAEEKIEMDLEIKKLIDKVVIADSRQLLLTCFSKRENGGDTRIHSESETSEETCPQDPF